MAVKPAVPLVPRSQGRSVQKPVAIVVIEPQADWCRATGAPVGTVVIGRIVELIADIACLPVRVVDMGTCRVRGHGVC